MLIGEPNAKESPTYPELAYWLALNQRSNYFSPHVLARALEVTGRSLQELWRADKNTLARAGFGSKTVDEFVKVRSSSIVAETSKTVQSLEKQGIDIIRFIDGDYPQQLRDIPSSVIPPLILFHKGNLRDFSNCVGIVGTRDATFRGRSMARKIAKVLADDGFTIVSGLARGTDVEAHMGALESRKGKTIAVLAWFDPVYPEEH
ncbi:MAG: DNA-processing protein DprA, partial [Candidatus Bathyarchaeia archaeon]